MQARRSILRQAAWPIVQATASARVASGVAADALQLLADMIGSGNVARHLQVEGDGLAQVCQSLYHSETLCASDALPARDYRDLVQPQVQVWRSYASPHTRR